MGRGLGNTRKNEKRMQLTVEPVARLIEEFAKLPGVGPKTAQRLTFYLLRMPPETARALGEAILQMRETRMPSGAISLRR